MIIRELKLERFGHFADAGLPLAPGLTLLYGPNEAGKSTLLAALRAVLFGFPRGAQLDFRFAADALAVAGTLAFADGQVAELRRDKKRLKGKLGELTLTDELLRARLGRPSEPLFSTVFAFSLDDLARGGEALRDEGLRAALAGAGVSAARSPQAVIEALRHEAEALFTAKGRSGKAITGALAAIQEERRALADAQLRGDDYHARVGERDAARAEAARLGDERKRLLARAGEHEALLRALPRRDELRGAQAERRALQPPAGLPPTAGDDYARAGDERARLDEQARALDEKLERARREAAALVIDEPLLAAAARVRPLHEQLGRYVQEAGELDELANTLKARRTEVTRRLSELRRGWTPDELDVLPHPLFTNGLERLREGWSGWRERARELGELAQRRAQLDDERARLRRRLDPPWPLADGTPFLPVPRAEEVKQQRAALERLERARAELARDDERLRREQRELESKRARLDAGGAVPSPDELGRLRAARDGALAALRRQLAAAAPTSADAHDSPAHPHVSPAHPHVSPAHPHVSPAHPHAHDSPAPAHPHDSPAHPHVSPAHPHDSPAHPHDSPAHPHDSPAHPHAHDSPAHAHPHDSPAHPHAHDSPAHPHAHVSPAHPRADAGALVQRADALQAAIAAADAHADELRRRSEDVAARAELTLRLGDIERARADRAAQAVALADERAHADAAWTALWSRCGFAPQSPDTMLEWLGDHAQLRELDGERERLDARAATLRAAQDDYAQRLAAVMQTLQLAEVTELPAQKRVIDVVLELRETLDQLRRDDERLRKLGASVAAFRDGVRKLCGEAQPTLAELEAAAALRALDERLRAAQAARQRRDELERAARELGDERQRAARRRDEVAATLAAWRRRAQLGDDDDGAFLQAAAAARRAATLDREIERLVRAVAEARGGMAEAAFAAALETAEPALVDDELAALRGRLEQVDAELDAANRRVGAAETQLAQLDGGARAAALTMGLESRRTELRALVDDYAVATLARALLEQQVARFQERHQPQLLGELSALFAQLTEGRYQRVYQRLDDDSTFVAVRTDGSEVTPKAMSTGTREQLYLAVRLAYVRHYCSASEPLPLVLDDVLVNFDAGRARATLRVLAEFAGRVQVLLLTCHEHLAALAADVAGVTPLPLPASA